MISYKEMLENIDSDEIKFTRPKEVLSFEFLDLLKNDSEIYKDEKYIYCRNEYDVSFVEIESLKKHTLKLQEDLRNSKIITNKFPEILI